MPYDSIQDLPQHVRTNMSEACQRTYREAYNDIEQRQSGLDESEKHQRAYGAVQDQCSREDEDDTWTKDPEHSGAARQEQNAAHEQLSDGVGTADVGNDDVPRVRVVPIGEGDTTTGHSGEPTYWSRDTLKDAVESGALDGTKIIKGRAGRGHKDSVDEQAAPEDIIGRVDEWTYEEGVGPVGESVLVDEQMAARIEHGLLDVSPDLYRYLGEFDESLGDGGAKPAEEIIGMPYITVLDRGAGNTASIDIEPSTAEALGYNPDADIDDTLIEQLASTHSPTYSGTTESSEWGRSALADLSADEDLSEAAQHFLASTSGFPPENYSDLKLQVVNENGSLDLAGLRAAASRLSQTGGLTSEDESSLRSTITRLANEEFDADFGEQNSASDELADTSTSDAGDTDSPTTTPMSDTDIDDLREQLATSQSRVSDLEETKEQLADQNDDLEAELASVKDERDSLADENDDLESRVEELETDFAPIKEAIAGIAAGDSQATAEQMADRFDGDELIDMLADEEDDRSPAEQVKEQLAAGVEPRGGSDDEESTPDDYTEEQLAAADDRAYEVLSGSDLSQMGEQSPREYVKEQMGVDPATVESRAELRRKVNGHGGD